MKKIPYLYQKLAEMLRGNDGKTLKLPDLQKQLIGFRIEKREALAIAKELEKQGVVILDVERGVNRHLKIRVCTKGFARLYKICFTILLICLVLLTYSTIWCVVC